MRFTGKVRSGQGKHNQMVVPGREGISSPPEGWPSAFQPGSLNVGIPGTGYPDGFSDPDNGGRGVVQLDDGEPTPALVLKWDQIQNNGLKPKQAKPRRGTGQFWPVLLTNTSTGKSCRCWLFRRINSTIKRQLELIAEGSLRNALALSDRTEVNVDILLNGNESEDRTTPCTPTK